MADPDELMVRFQKGSEEAFEELYREFSPMVRRWCYRLLGKLAREADDAAAEVFVKIARSPRNWSSQGHFKVWVFRICQTTCFDLRRRMKRGPEENGSPSEENPEDVDVQAPLELERRSDRNRLRERLLGQVELLPEAQQDVVYLLVLGELTSGEVAEYLAIPIGTVKARLRLALKVLRRELAEDPIFRELVHHVAV